MYLSRLALDPRDRGVRRDLADVYQMHRTIMSAFPQVEEPGQARTRLAVLYRVDADRRTGRVVLLVQSKLKPDWDCLPAGYLADGVGELSNPATKSVAAAWAALRAGQTLRFRLRANPTKKIDTKSGPDGRRRHGRRVDLRTEAQQIDWLARRAERAGFGLLPVLSDSDVPAVRVGAGEKLLGKGRRLTLVGVRFEGLLQIEDLDRFRRALEEGIGPGKAFGCGLMSVAPYRRHA
ncbi:MAG: type I-E CRISPR-associated protein Cas6/Cse3/CasE [Chloroflexi bacterium]|nr:type I-E CRISPR-associated protein Cas6/Cse3/CasE [Chloroflexota bacterium]